MAGVGGQPLTADDLVADLRRLGVRAGDSVMVHASLRAVGPTERGAATVVEALDSAVGPDGTVLMLLGARDDSGWVNERPEAEREQLLVGTAPFDPLLTPASPEVGTLAEVFRQTRGTVVSNHPEGRFAARGRLAGAFLEDVPWHDYYGPGSPLERLVRAGGKVIRLGADLDTVTALHYAEYLAPVEGKRRVRRHRLVAGPNGPEVRHVDCLDDEDGIADNPGEDYFAVILRAFLATGRASQGLVGDARSELFAAADIVEVGVAWMAEHLQAPASSGGA